MARTMPTGMRTHAHGVLLEDESDGRPKLPPPLPEPGPNPDDILGVYLCGEAMGGVLCGVTQVERFARCSWIKTVYRVRVRYMIWTFQLQRDRCLTVMEREKEQGERRRRSGGEAPRLTAEELDVNGVGVGYGGDHLDEDSILGGSRMPSDRQENKTGERTQGEEEEGKKGDAIMVPFSFSLLTRSAYLDPQTPLPVHNLKMR